LNKININTFSIIILTSSILRGFIVLLFNNSNYTNIIYGTTTILVIILSIYALINSFKNKNIDIKYNNLLFYNLILYSLYIIIELLFKFNIDVSVFNYTLLPYLVFITIKIKEKYLIFILAFSTILYSIFTFYDFYLSNFLFNKEMASYYQQLFRPATYETFSRTGEFVRPGGILGSAHDTGNIFGIMSIFFFCKYVLEKNHNLLFIFLFFVSVTSLLLSQSATNILSCIFVIFVIFIFFIRKYTVKLISALLLGILFSFIILFLINYLIPLDNLGEILSIWTSRTSTDGDWQGMVNGFQFFHFLDFFHLIFGHASISNSNLINSEVAFIKILFDIGIFGFIYLFLIVTYPLRFNSTNLNFEKMYPPFFSILFSIVSLIHYGSIFRMPNILFLIILNTLIFQQITKFQKIKNG
jgi:hypothetical protein